MLFKALAVVLLLNAVHLSCQQTDEEIAENSVYVQFDKNEGDLLELTEWEDNMSTAKFRDITASVASNYCRNSTNDCNLRNLTSDFGSGDVMLDGEEEFFNGDIRLKVYISLTGKSLKDEEMLVIPKNSLIEILKMGKPTYDTGLTEPGMDYNITLMFVNEERVAPPADGSINTIMIIVSVLILLSAVLLAIVLKCKESMEEKKQLEQATGGRNQESVTLTDMKPKVEEDGAEAQPMI